MESWARLGSQICFSIERVDDLNKGELQIVLQEYEKTKIF